VRDARKKFSKTAPRLNGHGVGMMDPPVNDVTRAIAMMLPEAERQWRLAPSAHDVHA
jgi:hypothetical protein